MFKIIEKEKEGKIYRDIVVSIEGHSFLLKPAEFYSSKSKRYFSFLINTSPLLKNYKEQ